MIPGRLSRPRAMSTPGLSNVSRRSPLSLVKRTCSCRKPAVERQYRSKWGLDQRTGIVTIPSSQCPPAAVSTWSAIKSRLCSE